MTRHFTPHALPWWHGTRIALFIEGTSLYSSTKVLGFDIDYSRLLEYFSQDAHLIRAFYYTPVYDGQEYNPLRPLVDWLDYNGYTMVIKNSREYSDTTGGRKRSKYNVAIDIAVDMMDMAPYIDHAVLFSGDGDFRRLIEAVQRKGLRATIVSTAEHTPPIISDDLRRQADHFIDLATIRRFVEKTYKGDNETGGNTRVKELATTSTDHAVSDADALPERYRNP
ncbi:MAG: NYN domain-containing protein [Alphaproteobacteria bacterium GM7ARS4]|nr:NYN domain-containing protein [Alphaproteobacteria bacterium GM7ARS4]